MSDPQPLQTTTKTKTTVGVLLLIVGVGVLFALAALRVRTNRQAFTLRQVSTSSPTAVLRNPSASTGSPTEESTPASSAPLHTPAVGTSEGLCDNLDNDNDGAVDDGCDEDNDNYCAHVVAGASAATCTFGGGDCVDGTFEINPGVPENTSNLYDDNCDNIVG